MESREIVRRAVEFDAPPRLPFFLGEYWGKQLEGLNNGIVNDVCDCWEMDRQKSGWFFDNAVVDDWGCGWATTSSVKNMGQVVDHPLADWSRLTDYRPPNPRDPFYYERLGETIDNAGDRYVVVTSHFTLIERLHMLHGFTQTLEDLVLEPEKAEKVLDMIVAFKIAMFDELARRFGDRVHGLFLTDDWGTQKNTFISPKVFRDFFLPRYQAIAECIHGHGWHFHLHSCGRVNDFVPLFIESGMDVVNLQQPRAYGIEELGRLYAGKICFLTMVDIQSTLPKNDPALVRQEAVDLIRHWTTPDGGLIVFHYPDHEGIGVRYETMREMYDAFLDAGHCQR
jgi:hypothetical protein